MINQGSLVTALDNLYNAQKEKRTFNKAQGIANVSNVNAMSSTDLN